MRETFRPGKASHINVFCEIIEQLDRLEYSEMLVEEILDLAQQAMMLKQPTDRW